MTTQTTTTPTVSPLMEIALRIREMRRITGFTEKEMAEKTGVTEAEYRSYETGTVDLPAQVFAGLRPRVDRSA